MNQTASTNYVLGILQHVNQGITVFDENLKLVLWNQKMIEILSMPDEMIYQGASFESLIRRNAERGEYGDGDTEEFVRSRVEIAKQFKPHRFVRECQNGTVLEINGGPLPTGGFITIYTDISEQKQREHRLEKDKAERTQALNRSEERLQLITDEMPGGIVHINSDLKVLFANSKFATAYGMSTDEIIGKHCFDFVHPSEHEVIRRHFDSARNGQTVEFEIEMTTPDGRVRHIRNYLRPDGKPIDGTCSFYCLSVDVTDYKSATTALMKSQKMDALGRLSSGIAHDFNNLLTVILGNLLFMQQQLDNSELHRKYLAPAISAARRGTGITDRLLDLAREKPVDTKSILFDSIVKDLYAVFRSSISENIMINLDTNASNIHVSVNQSEFEASIINIVVNANDSITGSGVIQISTTTTHLDNNAADILRVPAGHYAKVSIHDTGKGMSSNEIEHIFEPFHTTKSDVGGSGLGLALVYSFVRQSNGAVWVDSAVGTGTMVNIVLPVASTTRKLTRAKDNKSRKNPYRANALVLLVEDDNAVRRVVRRQLGQIGYQVVEASEAEDALSVLNKMVGINVVLSDVIMPGSKNGYELIKIVRQDYPTIGTVLMSGNRMSEEHHENSRAHVALLRKPFSKDELSSAIEESLVFSR